MLRKDVGEVKAEATTRRRRLCLTSSSRVLGRHFVWESSQSLQPAGKPARYGCRDTGRVLKVTHSERTHLHSRTNLQAYIPREPSRRSMGLLDWSLQLQTRPRTVRPDTVPDTDISLHVVTSYTTSGQVNRMRMWPASEHSPLNIQTASGIQIRAGGGGAAFSSRGPYQPRRDRRVIAPVLSACQTRTFMRLCEISLKCHKEAL
ncbi:hypothetical protein J6590_103768 [Homalodisca vitripennis]|nr:hypothetical protein J6590_103768 [Homalodisca vitripennis]